VSRGLRTRSWSRPVPASRSRATAAPCDLRHLRGQQPGSHHPEDGSSLRVKAISDGSRWCPGLAEGTARASGPGRTQRREPHRHAAADGRRWRFAAVSSMVRSPKPAPDTRGRRRSPLLCRHGGRAPPMLHHARDQRILQAPQRLGGRRPPSRPTSDSAQHGLLRPDRTVSPIGLSVIARAPPSRARPRAVSSAVTAYVYTLRNVSFSSCE
jgi:hypothetical protein